MKFKKPIEVQAGISDGDPTNPLGLSGYLLSSDGSNVNWVSPGGLSAETAEAIVQRIKANEALAKGDPLYIVGYNNGQNVNIVAKADSSDPTKMPVVGLADAAYANNAFGTMTAFGSFNGAFDTTGGTENWAIGDIIFVKPGGGLTNIKPGGTDLIQNIAIVSRVQQNTGELEVIALGRTNDVPNLPEGRLFVGTAANTSLASDVVYVDDTNDGVMVNCSSLTSSGTIASLAVGTRGGGSGPAVVTLSNSDTTSTAGDATGVIQFAIKDDSGSLGYTSALIQGSISQAAGQGNRGGGILDFYTAQLGTGNSPQPRMRINDSGDVGIGTTSPGSILHLEETNPTLKILSNQYYGNSKITMGNGLSEAGFITCLSNPVNSFLELRYDNTSTGDASIRVGQRNLDFRIDSGTAMYINSSKNVGIGTTSPGIYKLAVAGSTVIGGNVKVSDGIGGDEVLTLTPNTGSFKIGDIDGVGSEAYIEGDSSSIKILTGGAGLVETLVCDINQRVGIGISNPISKLQVNGGVQLANDTASPSAAKVGTFRYRTQGNNSFVDMCMQTGASTYAWVNIVTNNW